MVGLLAGMSAGLWAGEFAAPEAGPVAFRRDQIPLDVDTMVQLSSQLATLARGLNGDTAPRRRCAAQMLALAMALDPANTKPRDLLAEYQKGRHAPKADAKELEENRTRISQQFAWLENPEAGAQGHALAACLKDVLVSSDPKRPVDAPSNESEEKGAWAGWVPPLSAYQPKVVPKHDPSNNPDPNPEPVDVPKILLSHASVSALLWHKIESEESDATWVLSSEPLRMSALKLSGDLNSERPFSIGIGPPANQGPFEQVSTTLLQLLQQQYPKLPAGYRISITSPQLEQSMLSNHRQSLSGAAAVLASAAITGQEPEAIILGQIDASGAFKLPSNFWGCLQALLGKGKRQRLVMPTEAAPILPSLLAMETPGFFFEYEVLLASNFQELLEQSAKNPPEPLAKAVTQFGIIREKAGVQDIRHYITNRFVRQRLAEVSRDAPCHFSAKMLLIQAAGERPTVVPRKVLAAELRRTVTPMDWIYKNAVIVTEEWKVTKEKNYVNYSTYGYRFSAADIVKVGQIYEAARSQVDRLQRYVEKKDAALLEMALKDILVIRDLHKVLRTRGDPNYAGIYASCGVFTRSHQALSQVLLEEIGDPDIPETLKP